MGLLSSPAVWCKTSKSCFSFLISMGECLFDFVRTETKVNPFRDYKMLLLSSSDDQQSLQMLMKQLDTGEKIYCFVSLTVYIHGCFSTVSRC